MELMDKIANQFYKILIEFRDINDFFLLPLDSEIFQLKMMICSKLKIYEYSKLIILYNGEIISVLDEKTEVSHIFPSNEEEINLIICLDNNLLNSGVVGNFSWNGRLSNSLNSPNQIPRDQSPNQKKTNSKNSGVNEENNMNNNLLISDLMNLESNTKNEKLPTNNTRNNNFMNVEQNDNNYYVICGCNRRSEALFVCYYCSIFICEYCKNKEPHFFHIKSVVRVSKSFDYLKSFLLDYSMKLNKNILNEEKFQEIGNFERNYIHKLRDIDNTFSVVKDKIVSMKNKQLEYLDALKDKMKLKEHFDNANSIIDDFLKDLESFNVSNKDLELQINMRKRLISNYELIQSKFGIMKKNLFCYLNSRKDIKTFNKFLNKSIKEYSFISRTNFNEQMINNKLSKTIKVDPSKKKQKQKLDQVLIRLVDFKTILYYHFPSKIYKKRIFIDRSEFKANFEINDHIELNYFNKLFILVGKNHNMFFYYDFDLNEVIRLSDSKYSHYSGNMIYIPLNNSIYLLGGFNSKKCELYRNDDLFINNKAEDLSLNKNVWNAIPELNIFRQESSCALINKFLYIFFGYNIGIKENNHTIERINVLKNDEWEVINLKMNENISKELVCLNSNGIIPYREGEVLILGGYDGRSYKDTIFLFKAAAGEDASVEEFSLDIFPDKIPDINKNISYLFDKECKFISIGDYEADNTNKYFNFSMFDSRLRLHLVNSNYFKYEILLLKDD